MIELTEKQFQAQVIDLAGILGWTHYHTYSSRRSVAGFPDLVLVKPPRVIFAELKTERGELSPYQAEWAAQLRQCDGVEYWLWRPKDWDEIQGALT